MYEGFSYIWGNFKNCIMKKIMLLLLLVPFIGFSQLVKTSELKNAIPANGENFKEVGVWLNALNMYSSKAYEKTPVGIKHLFEDLDELLTLNSLDVNKPDSDKSLYASYAKDIRDYGIINTSILAEDAEIEMSWLVEPKNLIKIQLNKKEYLIIVK